MEVLEAHGRAIRLPDAVFAEIQNGEGLRTNQAKVNGDSFSPL